MFIVVGNDEYMKYLQRGLDDHYKNCLQKFGEWKRVYATVLETSVETALQVKMTTFKTNLLAYKRLALDKQASLPVVEALVPQPTNGVGQGDQLAKYLRNEAKGKMLAMYNKLKNNTDGIRQDVV